MIVYIDMDDVICDYTSRYKEKLKEVPSIAFPQSQYGFFRNLEPIEGAIESLKIIRMVRGIEPYILTAPSVRNPFSYAEKAEWVQKNLGNFYLERLIISPDKSLLKGDVLIDDRFAGKGQENFDGQFIHFNGMHCDGWKDAMDLLYDIQKDLT